MKTTTFGKSLYFISVYYTTENNEHHCHTESWYIKECAKSVFDLYTEYIGKNYIGDGWKGTITYVATFKAQQCKFA
jgi:hypothetical protein